MTMKFPSEEEFAKNVAEKALDEIEIDGHTVRQWIHIIAEQDAISRQALLEMAYDMSEIDGEHYTEPCMVVDIEDIQKLPPVTPQPKTGHWIDVDETHGKCDRCGAIFEMASPNGEANYCPNCGAKMVYPQESEGKE